MKKKTLILGIIALLLGLMLVLTGCGEKTNDGTSSSNKKGSREGLKVGDYVDYTYDKAEDYVLPGEKSGYTKYRTTTTVEQTVKQEDLRWQIFNIDEETGRVDLISSASGPEIYLNGLAAYNGGVTILNDICEKQYSNAELGIKARSINIEDIENKMNDSGKEKKTNQKNASGVKYGDIKNITEAKYCYYPSIYEQEINSGVNSEELKQDGIKDSEIGTVEGESFKQANKLTAKRTSYRIDKDFSSYFDTQVYDVLCKNKSAFWIASRGVDINEAFAKFELFVTTSEAMGTQTMYNSNQEEESVAMKHGFRPIVSIDGNIKIEAKEGTIQNMHTISK